MVDDKIKIYGLQKMTLLDYPGHVACTVFLAGCDFRCPFCHNFELACRKTPPVTDEDALLAFLKKRQGLLDGVAFTGGEPCLCPDLPGMMGRVKELGFLVKLDTNGCHPGVLADVLDKGLADYVAMDIKNSPEKYALTSGTGQVDMGRIRESIRLIMDKAADYEFRTTVVDEFHEPRDFEGIGELIRGASRYFLQSFTDRETVPYGNLHEPGEEKLKACAAVIKDYVQYVGIRGIPDMDVSLL